MFVDVSSEGKQKIKAWSKDKTDVYELTYSFSGFTLANVIKVISK